MHTGSNRLGFLNLPVASAAASRAFFSALGFTFDDRFSDATTACLQLSETAYVMLLEHDRFADFTAKPTGDPGVDDLGDPGGVGRRPRRRRRVRRHRAGARRHTGEGPAGLRRAMYGRSFFDLDGHHWEVMWMSDAAVEQAGASSGAVGASA